MTVESVALGTALATPAIGWAVYVTITLRRLLWEHGKQAEATDGLGAVIGKNTEAFIVVARASRELAHYMRWLAKQQTGEEPPPYVDLGEMGG